MWCLAYLCPASESSFVTQLNEPKNDIYVLIWLEIVNYKKHISFKPLPNYNQYKSRKPNDQTDQKLYIDVIFFKCVLILNLEPAAHSHKVVV